MIEVEQSIIQGSPIFPEIVGYLKKSDISFKKSDILNLMILSRNPLNDEKNLRQKIGLQFLSKIQ